MNTMHEDLIKELQEAGCPEGIDLADTYEEWREWVEPSLEELMAWCGDDFGSLEKAGSQFIALEPKHRQTIPVMNYYKTPEEAVARLGIAIHKK